VRTNICEKPECLIMVLNILNKKRVLGIMLALILGGKAVKSQIFGIHSLFFGCRLQVAAVKFVKSQ
jgi:hypothetical protein